MLDVNRRKHIPDQNHALSLTDVRLEFICVKTEYPHPTQA